jgi:hypothetical protein
VKIELRSGLVEVPGGLPTFASEGLEARAMAIGAIAADSYDYVADLLHLRPKAQLLVLSEADWASKSDVPIYGLPNAGDGTLTVAGTEAPLWSEAGSMVPDADRAELEAAYSGPDGSLAFGPFFDLIAVHEVAHLFHMGTVHFPRMWLQELFANLCLHAWVERRAPASRATLSHAAAPRSKGATGCVRLSNGRRLRARVHGDARPELRLVTVPTADGRGRGLRLGRRARGCAALRRLPAGRGCPCHPAG